MRPRIVHILYGVLVLVAINIPVSASSNGNHGFSIKGKPVNPRCVELLQTWLSESTSIILQSVVLDSCQTSNLAFEGRTPLVDESGWISYNIETDANRGFAYRVVGRLRNGLFVLQHGGYLGLYKIENRFLVFDMNDVDARYVDVLSKLGSSGFLPCTLDVSIEDNVIIVTQQKYDAFKPRPDQCAEEVKSLRLDVSTWHF